MLELNNNPVVRISNAGYTIRQDGKPDLVLDSPNRLVTHSARDLCPFCYLWDLKPENLPEGLTFEVQSASSAIVDFPHPDRAREALVHIAEVLSQRKVTDHAYNLHFSWTHMHSGREIFGSIIKMHHVLVGDGLLSAPTPQKLVITTNEDGGWYFRDSLNPGFPQDLLGMYEILHQLLLPIWKAGNSVTVTSTEFHVLHDRLRLVLFRDTRYTKAQRCELNPHHQDQISQILTGAPVRQVVAPLVPVQRIVEDEHGNTQEIVAQSSDGPVEFRPFQKSPREEKFENTPLFKLLWGNVDQIAFVSSATAPYPRAKQIDLPEIDTTFWFDPLQGHVWCNSGTRHMMAESKDLYYDCLGIDQVIAAIRQARAKGRVYYTDNAIHNPQFWSDLNLGIQFMGSSCEPRRIEARSHEAGDLFTGVEYWTITPSVPDYHQGKIMTERGHQIDTTMSEHQFRECPANAIIKPNVDSAWPNFVHSFRPKPGHVIRFTASTGDVFEADVLTGEIWKDQTVTPSRGILSIDQSTRLCWAIGDRAIVKSWLTPQFWVSLGYEVTKLSDLPTTDISSLSRNGILTLAPSGRYRISAYRARSRYVRRDAMEDTSIYQLATKNAVHQPRLVPKLPAGRYMRINISDTVDVNICTGRYYRMFRNEIYEYGYEYGELSKNEQYRLFKYLKMLCAEDTPEQVLIEHGSPRPLYVPGPVLQVRYDTPEAIKALMLGYPLESLAIGDASNNPYTDETLDEVREPDGDVTMRHVQVGNNVGIDMLTGQVYVGFQDGPWRIYGMPKMLSLEHVRELSKDIEPWIHSEHIQSKPKVFMATAASWMIRSGSPDSLLNSTPANMALEISKYIDFTGLKLVRAGMEGWYLERNTGNVYFFDELTGWVKKWGDSVEIDPMDAIEYLDATERGIPVEQDIINRYSIENIKTLPLVDSARLVESTPAWVFKATGYDAEQMNKEVCDESHGIHVTEKGLTEYLDVHLDIGTGSLYFSTPLNQHNFLKVPSLIRISAGMAYDLIYFYGYHKRLEIYSVHTWVMAGFHVCMLPSGVQTPRRITYNPANGSIEISSPNNRFRVSTIVYHDSTPEQQQPSPVEEVYVKDSEEILLPQLLRRPRKHDAEAELRTLAGKQSAKSAKALARAGIEEKREPRRITGPWSIPCPMTDQLTGNIVLGAESLMALEKLARRHKMIEGDSLVFSDGEVLYKGPMDWDLKA